MGALRARISRRLVWALIASIVLHFTIAAFVLVHRAPMRTGVPEEVVSVTTTLQVVRRPLQARRIAPKPRPLPAAARPQSLPRSALAPAPPHRELARLSPVAPVAQAPIAQVHANSPTLVAQQPADFEKTLARLRVQNNPLNDTQHTVQAEAPRHYAFDVSGGVGSSPHGEGILTPEKSWQADGYDYYYVQYWVQYPDGSTETGIVPWPLRYTPADDPFRLHIQHFPLPIPLSDYTLPAGTSLHPLVAYCYEHRDELASCPIHHD